MTNPMNVNRQASFVHVIEPIFGDSVATKQGVHWKATRNRIVRGGFTPPLLKSYVPVFIKNNELLARTLAKHADSPKSFDIYEEILKTSIDTVCESVADYKMGCLENRNESIVQAIINVSHYGNLRLFDFWKYSDFLYSKMNDYKIFNDGLKVIWPTTAQILEACHRRRSDCKRDGVQLEENLLNHLIDSGEYTDEQLKGELIVMLFAGTETSSITLSYVLLMLAAHKEVQDKVYAELLQVYGESSGRPVHVDDLAQFTYMEMVLKETMRLFPAVPINTRELHDDVHTGGYRLPRGTAVYVSIYNIQRNDKYWTAPSTFDPERFSAENIPHHNPHAFVPFGVGARNCLGWKYAMVSMKITMATLLRQYEFHTNVNVDKLQYTSSTVLKLNGGHQVTITPRRRTD